MPRQKQESFPQRLVKIRKDRGLSQYDLADLTGISQRMIVHYEKHSKKIDAGVLVKLAKALKVSVDELMGYKAVKNKETLDRNVVRKARMLEELPTEAKKSVLRMIDTLHAATRKA
jgi:transcriptional regulator with XRE-family HTH domain